MRTVFRMLPILLLAGLGLAWLAGSWQRLPPVERAQLGAVVQGETIGGPGPGRRMSNRTENARGED